MDFSFAYRRFSLPFRVTVRTATGPWSHRDGMYLRLTSASGSVAYGEVSHIPGKSAGVRPSALDEAERFCRTLGERVDDQVVFRVPARLGSLRGAFSAALGHTAGPIVHRSLPVAALLPAGRAAFSEVGPMAEAGFRVFKWKVGVARAQDEMAMLDDLCAALPAAARVRLDANGSWDVRTASRWLERMEDRPIEFVEQPLAADSPGSEDRLRGLSEDHRVPIALDESVRDDADIQRWQDSGWRGYFVVKPALLGDARSALSTLSRSGARVVFSSTLETSIGARDALLTAFAWPGERTALGFGVWPLFSDRRFDGPVAAPFVHADDVERGNAAELWSALN